MAHTTPNLPPKTEPSNRQDTTGVPAIGVLTAALLMWLLIALLCLKGKIMQRNKSKTMMLYPGSFEDVVLEGVLVGVVPALFMFLVADILFSTLSINWLPVLLGLLVALISIGMEWLIAVPVWRKYTMNGLLRLGTARGLPLHGR